MPCELYSLPPFKMYSEYIGTPESRGKGGTNVEVVLGKGGDCCVVREVQVLEDEDEQEEDVCLLEAKDDEQETRENLRSPGHSRCKDTLRRKYTGDQGEQESGCSPGEFPERENQERNVR